MSYEKVKQGKRYKVGFKQTLKLVKTGLAKEVVIAQDAEPHVISQIVNTCLDHQIPVSYVESMTELGKACGIDVGAASVAIEK